MNQKEELVAKITVTKEAEEAVSQVVRRVNEDFDGGRVNRQDVASWILTQFIETYSDAEVQQLRTAFFSEIALLEAILKRAKQSGTVPSDLKVALRGQMSVSGHQPKRAKKLLTKESINDGLLKDEGRHESYKIQND